MCLAGPTAPLSVRPSQSDGSGSQHRIVLSRKRSRSSPSASPPNNPAAQSPVTPKAAAWTPILTRAGLTPIRAAATKRTLLEMEVSPGQLERGEVTDEALVSYGKLPLGRAVRLVKSLAAASTEATPALLLMRDTSSSLPTAAGQREHARCYSHYQDAEHPAFAMIPVQGPLCRIAR